MSTKCPTPKAHEAYENEPWGQFIKSIWGEQTHLCDVEAAARDVARHAAERVADARRKALQEAIAAIEAAPPLRSGPLAWRAGHDRGRKEFLRAIAALLDQPAPDTVTVPKEPTAEMIEALLRSIAEESGLVDVDTLQREEVRALTDVMTRIYRAIIDARPKG